MLMSSLKACELWAHPPPRLASLRSRSGCKDNDQFFKLIPGPWDASTYANKPRTRDQSRRRSAWSIFLILFRQSLCKTLDSHSISKIFSKHFTNSRNHFDLSVFFPFSFKIFMFV